MDSGKLRWQVPLGQARYKGVTAPASFGWGSPNIGGPMVTAGGLVFIGAALDARLRALDVATGRELWQAPLEAPGMSVPMTYLAGGRQFVVIAAGGNSRISPELSDALIVNPYDEAAMAEALHRALLLPEAEQEDILCEMNVIEQVGNVALSTVVQDAWARGQALSIHGWVYGLRDGLVKDLQVTMDAPDSVVPRFSAALKRYPRPAPTAAGDDDEPL